MKERLLTNWHLMRILRTGIGLMMVGMGIQSHDWMIGFLGAFFLYQGVTDTGCCGSRRCSNSNESLYRRRSTPAKEETIDYEEIK